jgi:hypothetical protein
VVLERRRVEGVNLWHPLDAPLPEQADRPVELPPGLGAAALAALRPRQPVLRRLSPQDEP